jgi:phosphoglycerate dehydrogenase-like enzyme
VSFPAVLFAGETFPAARDILREAAPQARIEVADVGGTPGQPLRALAADVLIPLMSRIDGAVMDRVAGLRLIHQWGAGLEGVDVGAATARGIAVGNVPSAASGNADSVAEWCVMAALALSRRLPELQMTIREGTVWGGPLGRALLGRTAGIVGLGGIGMALAARLRPFGMRLMAVTRRPGAARAAEAGADWTGGLGDLPELLRRSDYVFVCLPLTQDTARIIDSVAIAHMSPAACLINVGRGALVDEDALLQALAQGRLAGAALDVFAREPLPASSPLLREPRILATPHIAGVTDVSYGTIARYLADVIGRLAARQPLDHCVNWTAVAPSYYAR